MYNFIQLTSSNLNNKVAFKVNSIISIWEDPENGNHSYIEFDSRMTRATEIRIKESYQEIIRRIKETEGNPDSSTP